MLESGCSLSDNSVFLAAPHRIASGVWPPRQASNGHDKSRKVQSPGQEEAAACQRAPAETRQVPRWTTKSAEEMASFPGVLALSRKFERGQLSEGNVARLSQALPPSRTSR